MYTVIDYHPRQITTAEILEALRARCQEFGVDQAEVNRLAAQITEQRAKRETIQ